MRLRTRFLLSLITLIALMTIPAIFGAVRVREVRAIAFDLREHAARTAMTVGRLRTAVSDLDRHQRTYVATADPQVGLLVDGTVRGIAAGVDSLVAFGYGDELRQGGFPLDALIAVRDSLHVLVEAGELNGATLQIGTRAAPLIRQADAAIAYVSGAIDRGTAERLERADTIASAAARSTTLAFALAVMAALGLAWLAAGRLTGPLDRLRRAMGRVAEGRFQTEPDAAYERADEVGELFRSFQAMAHRLAELDRMKADFVGIASHDLKTPISVITGYAELMEEELSGSLEQRHRQLIHALWEQTRALGSRVNQLIEISRMEAGGLRLGLEEIDIPHFARTLHEEFSPFARSQGIAFTVFTDPAAPTFLIADPDCLHTEILGNLLGNAFKFTPRGGRVELRFEPAGNGRVAIQVSDDGPGIPGEDAPHVFDRYYRGRSTSGRVGSGLGLPIARAGVVAHGGSIELVDGGGRGATFRVELPLRPSATPHPPAELRAAH